MGFAEEMLEKCGWNYKETKERFMGVEAMVEKFFNKFLDDTSYENLVKAYADGDRANVTHYAHALKGVSSNMGLKFLSQAAYDLQIAGETDGADIDQPYAKVVSEYEKAVPMIREHLGR